MVLVLVEDRKARVGSGCSGGGGGCGGVFVGYGGATNGIVYGESHFFEWMRSLLAFRTCAPVFV